MNKILYHSVKLHCEVERAFRMFTVNENLQSWLTVTADIEPVKLLSFEWKGPKQYKHFMNNADPLTHVVVAFIPWGEKSTQTPFTEIHLTHSGWRSSPDWDEARLWFENAWNVAFEKPRKLVNG